MTPANRNYPALFADANEARAAREGRVSTRIKLLICAGCLALVGLLTLVAEPAITAHNAARLEAAE